MRMVTVIVAGCLLVLVVGCQNEKRKTPSENSGILKQQTRQLKNQLEQAVTENKQLKKQLKVLADIKPEVKLENLCIPKKIHITRYTNLYDKDKDGQKGTLIVYIRPTDGQGDTIKAAGAVDVELWDLSKEADQAKLGQWHIGSSQLKKLWFSGLLGTNYRLTFDVADKVDKYEELLTVKVTFTDYLTGKVFKEQKVIKPR